MGRKLTPKQEKFCQCIVSGMTGKEAYLTAYNSKGNDQSIYTEASKLMLNESIQERLKVLRKPLEQAAQATVLSEREKKRQILWDGIEECKASGDHAAVARYMDILNKMDSEYININKTIEESQTNITSIDSDTLRRLSKAQ